MWWVAVGDDIVLLARDQMESQVMLDVVGKYAMKWRFSFKSKKSKTMMVDGKGSGVEWKIYEERMEIVEIFKYLGVWFDRELRGNVHLEKIKEKAEKWVVGARIGCMSRVNGEIGVDRGRLIWELLARPCLI